jgi:F0F1-type ATP synthase assembly protein I
MREGKPPQTVDVGRYLGLGLTWALSTALFLYLGSLVDRWLDTEPAFTVIGAFVGGAAGFYHLYYQLVKATRDGKDRDGNERR